MASCDLDVKFEQLHYVDCIVDLSFEFGSHCPHIIAAARKDTACEPEADDNPGLTPVNSHIM